MINLNSFKEFLYQQFDSRQIITVEFSSEVQDFVVDCFVDQPFNLVIQICDDLVKIATISKEPVLDFSLYDYVFNDLNEAKAFIIEVKENGYKSPAK